MQLKATGTPQDVYTMASIASGAKVQIQNKSGAPLMIYAGASAPVSKNDYFLIDAWGWGEYQDAVIMMWSGHANDGRFMVQEV